MIVLDTNVVSEAWKAAPNAGVLAWLDAQAIETLYLSAVTVAELRLGVATMPMGKRQRIFEERLEGEVLSAFSGRVLVFELGASRLYAEFMAWAKTEGRAIAGRTATSPPPPPCGALPSRRATRRPSSPPA